MTQAIFRWPHIAEARDQSYVSSCGVCGGRSMGQFSFQALRFSPMLHSHISFIFHVLCLTFWRRNYYFFILAHSVYKM